MEKPDLFLITGTSTGFGSGLVLQLNAQGRKVIATARNVEKIRDFEQLEHMSILKLDISSSQEEVARIVQGAIKIHGYVTHLMNNAAYGNNFKQIIGYFKVTDAILPHFRTRKEGDKFISNIIIDRNNYCPVYSFYCATKFAIKATFEALKSETQHLGNKVLLIKPEYFRTNLLQAETNIQKPTNRIADYAPIKNALGKVIQGKHGTW
ncbi:hypothetical protein E3Q19_02852 [Wallemia mellicola]|uniref:NAD(P)-binding protein n=1 Tax=Wallemia mellicola TaxID=1708541 RepID=A0A4T0PFT6_9BASI|nr:hypothetical protein E3Q19_02852 [Wallemia mellicola]TIC08097.1 hypothetical protein E3Q15_04057 [Wallemia mellicola]TIC23073.1 hypothetical protein E3Q11_03984 [Wallemia mellicola]TIC62317.1 hypothetical protein E3Q01_04007 [Wallemia mellicola]TIC74908.1 hypothetical protein E3Q00_01355 [Wallemia mellicola]